VKFRALTTIHTRAGVIDSGSVFTLKSSGLTKKAADELVQRGFARVEAEREAEKG